LSGKSVIHLFSSFLIAKNADDSCNAKATLGQQLLTLIDITLWNNTLRLVSVLKNQSTFKHDQG
jgi:hypothetical protein